MGARRSARAGAAARRGITHRGPRPARGAGDARRGPDAARYRLLVLALVALVLSTPASAEAFAEDGPPITFEARLPSPPSDVATDAHDTIYAASAADGTILRLTKGGPRTVAEWPGVFGLAAAPDGNICAGHHTDVEPLLRESRISCLRDGAWRPLLDGVGNGVHGLAPSPGGLWIAAWTATDVESRNGLVVVAAGAEILREIPLRELVPQFVAPLPDGGAIVSAWREDAGGVRGGVLLAVGRDGHTPWSDAPRLPAGLLATERGVWVADRERGTVSLFTLAGTETHVVHGWVTPMGLALSHEYGVCVAEEDARRIRCFDPASSHGGMS